MSEPRKARGRFDCPFLDLAVTFAAHPIIIPGAAETPIGRHRPRTIRAIR